MKGSLAASTMGWIEARKWNRQCLNKIVDAFVCPSQFIASKMNEDGFDESKLHVICNHIDSVKQKLFNSQSENRDNYYVYVGRLSTEKGVETLINVASKLPYALKIAGDGPLRLQLQEKYANNDNIEFLGQQNVEQVASLLSHARFSVVPSECWENNPLSVIESLCAGTPVVGANIGGIPELLDESNGLIFSAGNKDELTQSINKAFDKQWNVSAIEQQAINKFSHQRHLEQILDIYGKTQ